jgi:hypothetical protein
LRISVCFILHIHCSLVRFWCPSSYLSVYVVWEEWFDKQERSFSRCVFSRFRGRVLL